MNLETVAKLAKQANIPFYPPLDLTCSVESIYVFASLVAEAEREYNMQMLNVLIDAAVQAEREACAQLCEDHYMSDGDWCAKQIRERGQE